MSGSMLVDGRMPEQWEALAHHGGERACPVIELLVDFYGPKLGEWLLFERTCFPMSDAHALYQARLMVEKDQEPAVLKRLYGARRLARHEREEAA